MKQEDLFYNSIDKYFRSRINERFSDILVEKAKTCMKRNLDELISFILDELEQLGFKKENIDYRFNDHFLELRKKDIEKCNSGLDLYSIKIGPVLYEIFLEKIVNYLVNIKTGSVLMNLKARGFLPIEFILELRDIKTLFERDHEKAEKLKRYVQIQDKIVQKFVENREKIESLEDITRPRDKLQIIYIIYRIIDFFSIQKKFDFSTIIDYLKNNCDQWLDTAPLVSLRNPDIYYCGLYLATHLKIDYDVEKVKNFLNELYNENADEFESPLVEATDKIYYFLKATTMVKYWLSQEQLMSLINVEPSKFDPSNLTTFETSQLVVILKIYNILNIFNKADPQIIKNIREEIETRITPDGIIQLRDGFISSEATYYVLFCYYMVDALKKVNNLHLLDSVISRIYRNLELLSFSKEMNYDLISEIFYSCESLKLFNCIETKEMIIHLAKSFFPQEIVDYIVKSEDIGKTEARFRHLKVNRITGETIY
ncbi:MAG: hypothetical protein ACTSR8_21455 [Promethearchaeota archaeon]